MMRLGPVARGATLAMLWALSSLAAAQSSGVVYRCPGPPDLYTDALTPEEAKQKGCRTIEGAPITVMRSTPPRPQASAPTPAPAARPEGSRVDPGEQRARDSERRAILQAELQREEQRLAELKREYNDGQPERRGDERNYARYLERVAGMKAAIERKESDIAAIKRELDKLPN
ncbi:hypothetical protein [Azohydromonas sediminis]|uniref:hypothetical protein n=1 Tax=Azohydromonas sediminis TaxID=2259674 RepID=UPI001F3AAB56|nr:hypothetical protein [Azohydromonas sediminis]